MQGVTNYLTQLQYKAATQDDLWRHLTEQGHKDGTLAQEMDVKTVMDTWTLQMGFPLVTVTRDYEARAASVSQARFLVGDKRPDQAGLSWWVPITFTDPQVRSLLGS